MLNPKQRRWLKQRTHHLKPVVLVGQHGLAPGVLAEIDGALDYHELIKVRIGAGDREARAEAIERIRAHTQAELIGLVGHIAAFYRPNPTKREPLRLP